MEPSGGFWPFRAGDLPRDGDVPRDGDHPRDGGRLRDFYQPKGWLQTVKVIKGAKNLLGC